MDKLTVLTTKQEKLAGWIYLTFQLLALPVLLVLLNSFLSKPFSDAEINFIFFCLNFIATTVIFHRFLLQNLHPVIKKPMRLLTSTLWGLGFYWGGSIAVSYIIVFFGVDFFNVNDSSIGLLASQSFPLITVGTVLLAPVAEELFYRGLIFGSLYNRSRILAYLVSTLGFAAIHVVGYIGAYEPMHLLLCLLQYIPAGISLGWAYANADSIFAPMLMHVVINLIGMLSMR